MVDFVLDDLLTELETESTTYTFAYGGFALRSSIKIGSRTLAEYDYTNNRNNYLSAIDYGNGDKVQYTYDKQGRLVTQTYEDGDTVTYKYDNNGALATVIDSATGVSTKYYYDFMERLMKYAESDADYSHSVAYTYDLMNNLTGVVETINPIMYRGYVFDRELGMYYLQSRYYVPQIWRFLNADDLAYLGVDGTPMIPQKSLYIEEAFFGGSVKNSGLQILSAWRFGRFQKNKNTSF